MSRPRYEPIPQGDEVINLDSITNVAGYNYNSGIPNSIPSSAAPSYYGDGPRNPSQHHAPSIRSIPTSPPPSFHTHSSPGTPRPTPSTTAAGDYAELWGVAPSTVGAPTEMCSGSEALATISALQTRIARLEESVGRLLLEKEEGEPQNFKGGNCCMTFTDAPKALERGMSSAGGNCCIRFKSSRSIETERESRKEKLKCVNSVAVVLIICATILIILLIKREPHLPAPQDG